MITRYKDFYGCSASITDKADGTVRLVVRLGNGKKIHDKPHTNRKAATAAWRRMTS